jgi:hypothetical protein
MIDDDDSAAGRCMARRGNGPGTI